MRNWYTVGVLTAIVIPSRVPPRHGLEDSWLGSLVATVRTADGSTIRCRLKDAGDWISVYVDEDYNLQLPWKELRSIIDVGACVGSFTIWAGRRSPEARLIAVEPNSEVRPYLLENIQRNQMLERVTIIEGAIGPASGRGVIESETVRATEIRVVPAPEGQRGTVNVLSLEQLLSETGTEICDVLKMDCEGTEYEILLTAPESVLRRIRALVCEFHATTQHRPAEIVRRLTESGFLVHSDATAMGIIRATRPLRSLLNGR